jgi:hypothetical protein
MYTCSNKEGSSFSIARSLACSVRLDLSTLAALRRFGVRLVAWIVSAAVGIPEKAFRLWQCQATEAAKRFGRDLQ